MAKLTLVAWYEHKPAQLALLVGRLQQILARDLAGAFTARSMDTVHATIVGLEELPSGPQGEVRAHEIHCQVARFVALQRPVVQFGGFGSREQPFHSRGRPLSERMLSIQNGTVVLIGWPVSPDETATRSVAELRRVAEEGGVRHRYGDETPSGDPDVYLVIGRIARNVDATNAATRVRDMLAARPCQVPLLPSDVVLVAYESTDLPRETSRVWTAGEAPRT